MIAGAAVGGLYLYRMRNLSSHVVGVVKQLLREADTLIQKADNERAQGKKDEEIYSFKQEAYKKKEQAANLLMDYHQKNQDDQEVLKQLFDILESLQTDLGKTPTRRDQILDICKKLLRLVPERDSLQYRQRILELEWENRNLSAVLERAKDVLTRTAKTGGDYAAWRYLTMGTVLQLGSVGYQPPQGDAAFSLPPSMDELLDQVYRMKPEDVEISVIYADFVKDSKRKEYRDFSSEDLRKKSDEERNKKALSIINDMVNRNTENSKAYLARYHFKDKYDLLSQDNSKLDSDLDKVLQLNADDPEGLILAGIFASQQSVRARRGGDPTLAAERTAVAERYYLRNIDVNPENQTGYQFLGDFYLSQNNPTEAVRVWRSCLEKNKNANQEIIGRLVLGLIQLKQLDDANETIGLLDNVIKEYRLSNPLLTSRVQNLVKLLSARLYDAQAAEAVTKADASMTGGRIEEAKKFYAVAQKKYADASQILDQALRSFGKSTYDYIVDPVSIHSRIIGESLMLGGRLANDRSEWDVAVTYFQKAAKFPLFRDQATLAAAIAYQQMNLPTDATRLLAEAVEMNPGNIPIRNLYAQSLFRQEMSRVDPATRDLDAVEKQFRLLAENKDQLARPWVVDFRLIHLELIRESSSLDPERSIRAVQSAIQKYKALESTPLPTADDETVAEDEKDKKPAKKYSDDLTFLAELAGVYSSLSALPDFDRTLINIREFPQGELVYFEERIYDALRRNDKEGAIIIIEEAQSSDQLTLAQRQNFAVMTQKLQDDQPQTMDRLYAQLRTTFDQNPDSLKPQVFFLMANMALDREDTEYAKRLQERLETIEGPSGTMWRFVKARTLMLEKDPPMDVVLQMQKELVDLRPDWDMTYTLKAGIEERELIAQPNDKELKRKLIDTYRQAIRCGNTQQIMWNRLLFLLEETGQFDDVRQLQQDAIVRGVRLETAPGQFPQPYQRLYNQAYSAILNQDPQQADLVAKQCLTLAQNRRENVELIYSLNLGFGKLFLDNDMIESSKRHLIDVAKRGGSYVYPLAVCLAKDRKVDEGFTVILDEIERTPSSRVVLLPSILVLIAQVRPSETVLSRIDKIVTKIERGERPVIHSEVTTTDEPSVFNFGVKRIHSMTIRFPDSDVVPDPKHLTFFPPKTEE